MAMATLRVGGDQKDSSATHACRRTISPARIKQQRLVAIQNKQKGRPSVMGMDQPNQAAAMPMQPVNVVVGARARRYSVDRSMSVWISPSR